MCRVSALTFVTVTGIVSLAFLVQVKCQNSPSVIEFMLETGGVPGDGAQLFTNRTTAPAFLRSSKKLCATGLWALYTRPNFGQPNDLDTVSVYPIKGGTTSPVCTSAGVSGLLKNVNSIRLLANATSPTPVGFYPRKYFLANSNAEIFGGFPMAQVDQEKINSFAINKFLPTDNNKAIHICPTAMQTPNADCVCLDVVNNAPFLVPDLTKFPPEKPLMKIGMLAQKTDCNSCMGCIVPTPNAVRSEEEDLIYTEGGV